MAYEENKNDQSQAKIETKYKDPGRFDIAPYGQIWKVFGEKEQVDIWVQISKVEADSEWLKITPLFNADLQELLKDPVFMELIKSLLF